MDKNQIRQYLEYYQDLGFETIYRQATPKERAAAVAPEPQPPRSAQCLPRSPLP